MNARSVRARSKREVGSSLFIYYSHHNFVGNESSRLRVNIRKKFTQFFKIFLIDDNSYGTIWQCHKKQDLLLIIQGVKHVLQPGHSLAFLSKLFWDSKSFKIQHSAVLR